MPRTLSRTATALGLTLALGALAVGPALGAMGTATASVDILAPVSVTQTQNMDFGQILAPTSGSQNFVLAPAGGVTPLAGDGAHFGAGAAAQFTVAGEGGRAVSIATAVATDFSDAALSLGSLTHTGLLGDAIPGAGTDTVSVGGTLSVGAGANPAVTHTATISLTVNYN